MKSNSQKTSMPLSSAMKAKIGERKSKTIKVSKPAKAKKRGPAQINLGRKK